MAGFDLLADAGFDTDTAWATTFGRTHTSSTTRVVLVSLRARHRWRTHARLALGVARVAVVADRGHLDMSAPTVCLALVARF